MRMEIFTKGALAAAIALSAMTTVVAPSLAATRHHAHRQVNHPGILHPTPRQQVWGNEPMLDEGQGRYVPADSGKD